MKRSMRPTLLSVLLLALLPACTEAATPGPVAGAGSTVRPDATVASLAQRTLAAMTEAQRVGQLLMVGVPTVGSTTAARTAVEKYHVGSLILDGTTTAGRDAITALTTKLQLAAPQQAKLLIATDQEGGEVQRLQGSGFSSIPDALVQGHTAVATLRTEWTTWAHQLHRVGVNVNLGPVLDTVPYGIDNPPIGELDREFGHSYKPVSTHGLAALEGMATAHVDATVKHFPGLGRVTGNTDLTAGVTDTVTTRHDPYLVPFENAVAHHVPFVMVSTAIYTRIDAHHPAAFSYPIVTTMLRGDLHFSGVIISDDLGDARQVSSYAVGTRAVDFIRAGGDIVLTVDAGQAATMTRAILARVKTSPTFRKKVDAAALAVLQAKQSLGLLQ